MIGSIIGAIIAGAIVAVPLALAVPGLAFADTGHSGTDQREGHSQTQSADQSSTQGHSP